MRGTQCVNLIVHMVSSGRRRPLVTTLTTSLQPTLYRAPLPVEVAEPLSPYDGCVTAKRVLSVIVLSAC